jgi:hypothetical protein
MHYLRAASGISFLCTCIISYSSKMQKVLHFSQVEEFQHYSFCRIQYQELDNEKESKFYSHCSTTVKKVLSYSFC